VSWTKKLVVLCLSLAKLAGISNTLGWVIVLFRYVKGVTVQFPTRCEGIALGRCGSLAKTG